MNYKKRKEVLMNTLNEKGLKGYITTDLATIEYFTGIHTTTNPPKDLLMILYRDEIFVIVPLLEKDYFRDVGNGHFEIIEWKPTHKIEDLICNVIKRNEIIGYEPSKTPYKLITRLSKRSIKFRDVKDTVTYLRAIKEREEIELIRNAVKITESALYVAQEMIEEGKYTEEEIAREIHLTMIKNGCEEVSFDPIIATGENAAYPHYIPSNIKIKKDSFTLVDIGGRYKSYCSDITRTFSNGKIDDKKKFVYKSVKDALELAIEKIKDGVECKEIDLEARNHLKSKGLDSYFIHSLGHGIGIEIHELPTISIRSTSKLRKNMVITVEPGVYIKNNIGVRLEQDVLVLEDGAELLSTFTLDY